MFTVIHIPDEYQDGVQSTGPMTKKLMENIIKYKNLEPTESEDAAPLKSGQTVTMPEYIGSSAYQATLDLDAQGLNYKIVGTGNQITNQVPKVGTDVEIGSEVILYVEKSEEEIGTVKVPNVVGKSYDAAVKELTDLEFEVVFEGEEGGNVVSQSPKHGLSVEPGSEVTIKLEKAEKPEEGKTE